MTAVLDSLANGAAPFGDPAAISRPVWFAAFIALDPEAGSVIRINDMKAGKGNVVVSSVAEAREATGLSQSQFANLLGVSVRTLQG